MTIEQLITKFATGQNGSGLPSQLILNLLAEAILEKLDAITLLNGGSSTSATLNGALYIATTNGVIPAGKKYISIAVLSGTGTILGAVVQEGCSIVFPELNGVYSAIPYTVDANSSFLIQAVEAIES